MRVQGPMKIEHPWKDLTLNDHRFFAGIIRLPLKNTQKHTPSKNKIK
jgi:hypothetical protein